MSKEDDSPGPERVERPCNIFLYLVPRKTKLREFLGLVNFYHRFIPNSIRRMCGIRKFATQVPSVILIECIRLIYSVNNVML